MGLFINYCYLKLVLMLLSRFNSNYGGPFFDWLHGTDKSYKGSIDEKRGFKNWAFTPIRQVIPDNLKAKEDDKQ